MRHLLATLLLVCASRAVFANEALGVIGVTVSHSDYGLITGVTYRGPAAVAGIVTGDRLLRVGAHQVSALRTPEEFRRATSGLVGELVPVTIQRASDGSVVTIRLRRVDPESLKPKDIPPESDLRFFASATPRPNQALELTASRRTTSFSIIATASPAAARPFARSSSACSR